VIVDERPDLVYTALYDADIAGRIAAAGLPVPVMTNLVNTAYDKARAGDPNVSPLRLKAAQVLDGFTARHLTDHFHAISQAVKDSTVEQLGVAPNRITVVRRGRDAKRLGDRSEGRRITVRKTLGLLPEHQVILTVGRQEFQKGHTYLIEAFAGVLDENPWARLVIAGREGHATPALAAQVDQLGLGDSVFMLGHRDDVADLMAASDLFVFPSLYEGLGGALIEALGLGLPIVASDVPALREVVREGVNADLVPPGDPKALAIAMGRLLNDRGRLQSYGDASRSIFDAEFRLEVSLGQTLALLDRVARQRE
jgi:glycosyltransferase involved in cell wall biosynthesis